VSDPFLAATVTVIGGEVRAQVADDLGGAEDEQALADAIRAGRRQRQADDMLLAALREALAETAVRGEP
jgi:hypothetical protein